MLVLLNNDSYSCLWDISRYGSESVAEFESRAEKLFKHLDMILSPNCLFFWMSSLPVHTNAHKAFMVPRLVHKGHSIRVDLLQANFFIHMLCYEYERDFLDLNFHCRDLTLFHQLSDGLHWDGYANRQFSSYIIRYIADSLGIKMDPRANLIEYHSSSLIEIDPITCTVSSTWKQTAPLSPESSSDWGKVKYKRRESRFSDKPPEVSETPLASYSSHYIQSLISGVPDLPVQYLDKNKKSSASPNVNQVVSENESNEAKHETLTLKTRTPISYGDLFSERTPKARKKRKTKGEKKQELLEAALSTTLQNTSSLNFAKNSVTAIAKPGTSKPDVPDPPEPPKPRILGVPPPPIRSSGAGQPFESRKQLPKPKGRGRPNFAKRTNPVQFPTAKVTPKVKAVVIPVEKEFSDASSFEESDEEKKADWEPGEIKTEDDDEDEFFQPQIASSLSSSFRNNASGKDTSNSSKKTSKNLYFSNFI